MYGVQIQLVTIDQLCPTFIMEYNMKMCTKSIFLMIDCATFISLIHMCANTDYVFVELISNMKNLMIWDSFFGSILFCANVIPFYSKWWLCSSFMLFLWLQPDWYFWIANFKKTYREEKGADDRVLASWRTYFKYI